jgi:alpha-aminoadipate carrier protein LysW
MVGEIITCADCGADFEIASKSEDKIELKAAESIGEDWGE